MALEEINALDEVGQAFNKTNEAINNIIVSGSLNGNILTYTTFSGSTIEVALPVTESGTVLLTQSGTIEIAGVDPSCTVDIPALSYTYNGEQKNTLSASLPFVAPDPTFDRVDAVVLDPVLNSVSVVNGTPSGAPVAPTVASPDFLLGSIYVFGGQPCENSSIIYSAIQQQLAEILTALNIKLLNGTKSVLSEWDAVYSYIIGDVAQVDGTFYKALTNNVNSDPTVNPLDWEEVEMGGAGFVASGVVYVDSTFVGTPDGSYDKPYTTIQDAVTNIPTNTPTKIECLGTTINWGSTVVGAENKYVHIDARGRDLTSAYDVFASFTYLSIDCANFTHNSTSVFCKNTGLNYFMRINASNKIDIVNNNTGFLHEGGVLVLNCYEITTNTYLNSFAGSVMYLNAFKGSCTSLLAGFNTIYNINIADTFTSTYNSGIFQLNQAGCKLNGGTWKFTNASGKLAVGCNNAFEANNVHFECVGDLLSSCSYFDFNGGSITSTAGKLSATTLPFTNLTGVDLDLNMSGSSAGTYGIETSGTSKLTGCNVVIGTAGRNGVAGNIDALDIAGTNVELADGTDTAFDTYNDNGGNSQSPMLNPAVVGTELITAKTVGGDFVELTASGFGGSGDLLKVSANDTTAGYLEDKADSSGADGVGIIRAVENEGANEKLQFRLGNHYLALASTGLYTGAVLSVGASTGTFDITAGEGFWVDSNTNFTDVKNNVQPVIISARTNEAVANIGTQPVTYIMIDKNDTILQLSNFPTAQQRRENIFIGVVVHSDNVNVNVVNNLQVTANDITAQLGDVMEGLGFFNLSGNRITANGTNLSIDKSAGTSFKRGANYVNNKFDPHTLTLPIQTLATFRYRNQNSSEGADITVLDPTTYDNAGVTTTVPANNNATIQRVYIFPSGAIRVQRGQEVFSTISDAIDAVGKEPFVTESNIEENGLLLASIVIKKTATDLTDTGESQIFIASKFGELGSVGSSATTNLQQAYDNSIDPEILTDSTRLALTLQRGSGADTDNVLEVKNGAGSNTFSVDGNGLVTGDGSGLTNVKPTLSRTISYETPTASDDITIFRTDVAITVQEVIAVSTGTTPSTTYQLKHNTDRSAVGNDLTTSGATTNVITGDIATLSDATIPADSWVWLETTLASGTNVTLSIDIRYTED